ncbi:hypothetical protein [Lentzea sp. E54]|uniref:hypothetical protein n=1 Tax=Lentzea xerophila TaxID=3435883 RepID=UPI003DA5C76B
MFSVGFFGTYAYEHGSWKTLSEGELPPLDEPSLWIDIHDSDITSVVYAPTGPGSGVAYLGLTPRTYFEEPQRLRPDRCPPRGGGPGRVVGAAQLR